MLIKGVFYKLVFILIIMVAWIVYAYRDNITYTLGKTWYVAVKSIKQMFPRQEGDAVKTYTWTDATGKVHFSNIKPQGVTEIEMNSIVLDRNIIESVSNYDIPRTEVQKNPGSSVLFERIPELIQGATAVENTRAGTQY